MHKALGVLYPLVKYTKCLELCVLTQWMTAGKDDGSNVKHACLLHCHACTWLLHTLTRGHACPDGAPLGHSVQVEAPVTGLYVPTGQLRHCRTALHFGWHSASTNAIVTEQPMQMLSPHKSTQGSNIRHRGDS